MHGCDHWTLKEAECLKIDDFKLWCWRRLLRVPGLQKTKPVNPKGNQSWIFIGRTDVEAETPILWPPDAKSCSFEKTLMLGKIEGRRRRGNRGWDGWMASPTQWTWVWVSSRGCWRTGRLGMLQSMNSQSWTWLSNWTTTTLVSESFAWKNI